MLISFVVTAKLICVFVFTYAKCWFSHGVAQLCSLMMHLSVFSMEAEIQRVFGRENIPTHGNEIEHIDTGLTRNKSIIMSSLKSKERGWGRQLYRIINPVSEINFVPTWKVQSRALFILKVVCANLKVVIMIKCSTNKYFVRLFFTYPYEANHYTFILFITLFIITRFWI